MKTKTLLLTLTFILSIHAVSFGTSNLFFFKTYGDDFKKNNTTSFVGGDPIYGLINVSPIGINDNNITSIDEFADQSGNIQIRVYFASLDKEVSWRIVLSSGLVKKNRFLFAIVPDAADKVDKDIVAPLKNTRIVLLIWLRQLK